MQDFWNTVMLLGHADVSRPGRVPIDTGHLRNSLSPGGGKTSIDPSPIPMWAQIDTNVSYAPYLEDEDGTDKYHYRGGPSKGKPTRGWLSATIPNIQSGVEAAVQRCAAAIEAAWKG